VLRKLRIFHLIKSLNRGGAETLLAEGLRFADRDRFELLYGYYNPQADALAPTLRAGGASVTCFGGASHLTMLGRTARLSRFLRDEQVDLVHCHLPTAGIVGRFAARIAGVPVVYTEHNKPEWYRKPTFLLNAWTYELQKQVIAVSASVEESIRRYIRPRVPVTVIRNGIDASLFRRPDAADATVRARFDIPPHAVVVGNVAAFIPQKRLDDWIRAAQIIHGHHIGVRFLLVGEGPQEAQLARQIAELGLDGVVHLCGVQSDVRPYLAAMDIYMMSSAFEGLPVALLEAMAMQCAPVCTAVGGIPEVLRDGSNGLLTQPGRPEDLAQAVIGLLGDPQHIRSFGNAARDTVLREFSIERMTREVESLYMKVLGGQASGRSPSAHPQVASR
jgi:glycosyltransferase involved in cell wall biosynthesis